MADVRFREAVPADATAFATFLRSVWERSGPDAPGFAGATDAVIGELTTEEAILARIGGPARRLFLASQAGHVIGFAATRREPDGVVELAGIIVDPDAVGRGVGTGLVHIAEKRARDDGYIRMVVRTETTNDTAIGFYERNGFTRDRQVIEEVDDVSVEVWELTKHLATR